MGLLALMGQHPLSANDKTIYKALLEVSPSTINPDRQYPFGPPAPADASHHSRSSSLVIGMSFAMALVILVTGARLWVRTFRSRALGADDITIIPAAIGSLAYMALDISIVRAGGLGKHLYDCTYEEIGWFVTLSQSNYPIFYFTVFTVKISIVLMNRRITGMTSKNWQKAHWTYFTILVILMVTCIFLNIFSCSPIATAFTLSSIGKMEDPRKIECLDRNAISLATRAVHIITDWLLLPVPLIIVWRLQMPLRKRIKLMLVFGIGLISSIASIVRNILSERATIDVTYDYYYVFAWDMVDISFATMVASLPALNGLVDSAFSTLRTWVSTHISHPFSKLSMSQSSSRGYRNRIWDQGSKDGSQVGVHGNVISNSSNSSANQRNNPVWGEADIELETQARRWTVN